MRTLEGSRPRRWAARSRSISTATTRRTRPASGAVSAPLPGPISRKTSSGAGESDSRSFATHAGSRKCWPNRFRARGRGLILVVFIRPQCLAAPVALFNLLDLFLAHTEVVADFVNERFADDRAQFILVFAVLLDRALKERDTVREVVPECPGAFGQRRALVEAKERVW